MFSCCFNAASKRAAINATIDDPAAPPMNSPELRVSTAESTTSGKDLLAPTCTAAGVKDCVLQHTQKSELPCANNASTLASTEDMRPQVRQSLSS